jgi:uncharacterized protein YciI
MKHFLLFYTVADDYLERRGTYRNQHLEKAWASHDQGELLLGGALTEPADMSVLLFKAESRAVVEDFAKNDPYVTNGLVKSWSVREWATVAGDWSVNPIKPQPA